jgi:hypothetical protein
MFFVNLTLGQFAVLMTSATAFLLAIYLLERARRKQVVSTLKFWVAAQHPTPVLRRKRIQQPWSLLLQLAGIALLLLAIAQLQWGTQAGAPRDHVLLLDTSAWMSARSGNSSLMQQARERALAWLRNVPRSDRVLLVRADGLTTPATALGSTRRTVEAAIRNSEPGATGLNLDQAFDFARRFQEQAGRRAGEIVYVGPGKVAEREGGSLAAPRNLRVLRVADNVPNSGLRKIGLRRSPSEPDVWEIFVSAKNYSSAPRKLSLGLTFGGAPAGSSELALGPGEEREATFRYRTRAAGLLKAALTPRDGFPADDEATLELPEQPAIRVTVYSAEPQLLRPVLAASPRVEAAFRAPGQYRADAADGLVILDRFRPPTPPMGHAIWIDPPEGSPVPVRQRVAKAEFTGWRSDHQLAAGLRTKGFSLENAAVFQPSAEDIRIGEVANGPVIVARPGERKVVVLGFHPARSGLRYELTTPLLFANILRWTYPEMFRRWELSGGSVGTVKMALDTDFEAKDVKVVRDDGSPVAFTARDQALVFFSGSPGTVRVMAGDREIVYSQTLPQLWETQWQPPADARTGMPRFRDRVAAATELWHWLAIAGALCLLLEWFLYGRLTQRLRVHLKPALAMRKAS